jgi:hypothetical protein
MMIMARTTSQSHYTHSPTRPIDWDSPDWTSGSCSHLQYIEWPYITIPTDIIWSSSCCDGDHPVHCRSMALFKLNYKVYWHNLGLESVRWTSVSCSHLLNILRPFLATALSNCSYDDHGAHWRSFALYLLIYKLDWLIVGKSLVLPTGRQDHAHTYNKVTSNNHT